MKFLRGLFSPRSGASETPRAEASVEYNGYTITPAPEKDPAGWRVAGTISKEISGDRRVYRLDRADTSADRETIVAATIEKAKRVIDEQGDWLFADARPWRSSS
ncbi:MAG: hypothetical protein HY002_00370 [Candidatus Rokubacteria bacterium]|nr:hypothetical protein [Candidatus Rokubacteria bacterium]